MRLTDLNPGWVGVGGEGVTNGDGSPVRERRGIGVMFDCPCGAAFSPCYVPFANPLDGGPQHGAQGWRRVGDTFDSLTLTPSILRTGSKCACKWHGYITNGEVITV